MVRTDLRILKTKEALQSALLELLDEKNLESISIAEICRKAKVNRGTFYLHYNQIDHLFAEYFNEITEDLGKSYQEPFRYVTLSTLHELNPDSIRIFHHVERYKKFYRIIFSENVPIMYYYLLYEEMKSLIANDSVSLLEEGLNNHLFCSYQANAIIGMVIEWCKQDFSYSVDYLNHQLAKFILLQLPAASDT